MNASTVGVFILVIFIVFIVLISIHYYKKNHEIIQKWKADKTAKFIAHAAKPFGFLKKLKIIRNQDKDPNEWKYLDYNGNILYYLTILTKSDKINGKNNSAINNSVSNSNTSRNNDNSANTSASKSGNDNSNDFINDNSVKNNNSGNSAINRNTNSAINNGYANVKHLVILHGSTWSLEYCYHEYKEIADQYNVDIISLEYPGFGERYKLNNDKTTEHNMLETYPQEVIFLIEYLQLKWENIAIVAQCLGAPIGIKLASNQQISKRLHSLCLTKPFTSWHNVLKETIIFSPFLYISSNVFKCENTPYLEDIYCHFYCVQGEKDGLCGVEKTRKLVKDIRNCKSSLFIIVPDVGHDLVMPYCIKLIRDKLFCFS